jgi:hypothetical protein
MANTRSGLVAARIYESDDQGKPVSGGVSIDCMFNPFEYTVSKSNTYGEKAGNNTDVPQIEFKKAGAQTLKLDLIFDTYETGEDVSLLTNKLWKFMEVKTRENGSATDKVPPPDVAFEWGVFRFVSVITSMTQKFTLFKPDGTPVRARVDVTFTQHVDLQDYPGQNPTSGSDRVERMWHVTAGDRLDLIADQVYGDANKWRLIAEHNHLANPLLLRPGYHLTIPED